MKIVLLLFSVFYFHSMEVGASSSKTCSDTLFFKILQSSRPDVIRAIESRDVENLESNPEINGEGFYRENLEKYFKDEKNLFGFVTLYRGVDENQVSYDHIGEKNLYWTTLNLRRSLLFALKSLNHHSKYVHIFRIKVPRFMVYSKSGFPVLRYEDVQDLSPFIEGVAKISISRELLNFIRKNEGEVELVENYLRKKQPGLFDNSSQIWKRP